jgi:hypothetical protein
MKIGQIAASKLNSGSLPSLALLQHLTTKEMEWHWPLSKIRQKGHTVKQKADFA